METAFWGQGCVTEQAALQLSQYKIGQASLGNHVDHLRGANGSPRGPGDGSGPGARSMPEPTKSMAFLRRGPSPDGGRRVTNAAGPFEMNAQVAMLVVGYRTEFLWPCVGSRSIEVEHNGGGGSDSWR